MGWVVDGSSSSRASWLKQQQQVGSCGSGLRARVPLLLLLLLLDAARYSHRRRKEGGGRGRDAVLGTLGALITIQARTWIQDLFMIQARTWIQGLFTIWVRIRGLHCSFGSTRWPSSCACCLPSYCYWPPCRRRG